MTIRLIHVDLFETLYLCYGLKWQSGVIWGHWGQMVIFTKNAIICPCYIAWSYMVTLTYPLTSDPLYHICGIFRYPGVSQGSKSQNRQDTPSVTATCLVLLSSSFFWQHAFFTYFPTSDFDQTWSQWPVPWPLLRHKRWWGQGSLWGHWGQKGHFHQKGIKSFRLRSIKAWLMHMQ